jgi:hypothetical protein
MSKLETPMVVRYWERGAGTLIEEFLIVEKSSTCGPRRADAIILPSQATRRLPSGQRTGISITGQEVIVDQAKASRLGMYLMGQTLFSAELIRRLNPASIRSVALCTEDDSVLRPLFAPYSHLEIAVMAEFKRTVLRWVRACVAGGRKSS